MQCSENIRKASNRSPHEGSRHYKETQEIFESSSLQLRYFMRVWGQFCEETFPNISQ